VTIRFSKARHVRREPDEVRQQVEGSIDRKKRQAGLATLVEVFPLSRLLLHPSKLKVTPNGEVADTSSLQYLLPRHFSSRIAIS